MRRLGVHALVLNRLSFHRVSSRRVPAVLAVITVAVVGYVVWKRPAEPTPGAGASSASASALPPDVPTVRMRREMLRTKILTAILDEASAPPPREEPEHKGRSLTKALVGVPAVNFPTEYLADIYTKQLGPLTRQCFEEAEKRKPGVGGTVEVRYVIVAAPHLGGYVEDATIDESTIDDDELEECVHEAVLDLTFDRAPDQGGFKEAGFVMQFGDASAAPTDNDD